MRLTIPVVILAILLVALQSYSQDLDSVEWGGYIIISDSDGDEKEPVTFDVMNLGDEDSRNYKITMINNDQDYLFEKLDVKDDRIIFKLDTGSSYDCDLILQGDGSFSGDCIQLNSNNKNKIFIMMIPQEQEESIEPND